MHSDVTSVTHGQTDRHIHVTVLMMMTTVHVVGFEIRCKTKPPSRVKLRVRPLLVGFDQISFICLA